MEESEFTDDGRRVAIYILTGLVGERAGRVGWCVAVVVHSFIVWWVRREMSSREQRLKES
jgi:hypothetical protein